jgi:molybdate transport system ATP-binding protein
MPAPFASVAPTLWMQGGPSGLHVSLRCTAPVPLQADFDCAPGELVALVGPSGSGKTTLLRAMAGLFQSPHLQGHITLGDGALATTWFDSAQRIALAAQARRVGLVFQQYALFPHLSALGNIAVCADQSWTTAQKNAQALALLERMGLAPLAQRLPHQLSGGQQQRVALARALVRLLPLPERAAQPGVLLLDEPFSAVDAPMRQVLYRELAQLHASLQLPIVLVTHDLAEARRLADRVVIIDAGTTLQSGPPERVLRSPRNARVAQLVGIHNHFASQFYQSTAPQGTATLRWGSLALQAADKGKIDNDTAVTWVMAGDSVQVLAAGATAQTLATGAITGAATAAHEPGDNYLPCRLLEMLPLGEISLCKLAIDGAPADNVVALNLSTALLRSLQAQVGGALTLHLPAQALHIMPVRGAQGE